jgi:hypothetical protein
MVLQSLVYNPGERGVVVSRPTGIWVTTIIPEGEVVARLQVEQVVQNKRANACSAAVPLNIGTKSCKVCT